MWSTQDLHCSTRTFWKWFIIQQLIPHTLEFGAVFYHCHLILGDIRNFPLHIVDLRSIALWKQILQFDPRFPCCFTVRDAARNINVHRIDQPRKNHGIATLPILIQRWIKIWHQNLPIHEANLLLGSENKHHCSGPRMVILHPKQRPSNENIPWILTGIEKIGIRSIGIIVRIQACVCRLCVERIRGGIGFNGHHWRTFKTLIPCKILNSLSK